MLKEQKGITLVALIITIIVMLILAGVSISLVVGEGGVLNQAQQVEPAQLKGSLKEAIAMANGEIVINHYGDTTAATWSEVDTKDKLDTLIKANFQSYPSATLTYYTDDTATTPYSSGDINTIKAIKAENGDSTVIVKVDISKSATASYYTMKVNE